MKKWYFWLILTVLYAVCGILNYFDGDNITLDIVAVCITAVLAVSQFFCDRNGEKGKKIFKYICIAAIIVVVICLLSIIFKMF